MPRTAWIVRHGGDGPFSLREMRKVVPMQSTSADPFRKW
jgi:hypothetical protein